MGLRFVTTGIGAVLLVALSPLTASADPPRKSAAYGVSAVYAQVNHTPTGSSAYVEHQLRTDQTGSTRGFYNATVTAERCNGYGQDCGYVQQNYVAGHVYVVLFSVPPVYGHVYRTRGSWNDFYDGARYINAVSPFTT